MAYNVKIQGTRYQLEAKYNAPSDDWELLLTIGGAEEDKVDLRNTSLASFEESVKEIIKKNRIQVNEFQLDLMGKDLYKQVSGDSDLSKHEKAMAEHEEKKDPKIQESVVNEFKSAFKIKEDAPPKKTVAKESPKEQKTSSPKPQEKEVPESSPAPEMQEMMSEIAKEVVPPKKAEPQVSTSNKKKSSNLQAPIDPVDTRVSSVDIGDLIQELKDTKELLQDDINRLQQRMSKVDALIRKIGTISDKL